MAIRLNERFSLMQELGSGTQSTVWLAEDHSHCPPRRVALKVVNSCERRFLILEFERLAMVSHPGLAPVYGLFEADQNLAGLEVGQLYFATAYIDGPPLMAQVQQTHGLERVATLLSITAQVASALSAVHAHGLIHCDIKPANLRSQGETNQVMVLDLGLAQPAGTPADCGTPAYMAPEALAGAIDLRSDLYSLGLTIAEYALGERYFPQEHPKDLVPAILALSPKAIAQRFQAYPTPFVELLQCLLAAKPSDRPSGTHALLSHIRRVQEALGLPSTEVSKRLNFSRPEFVGRSTELKTLAQVFWDHRDGSAQGHIFRVAGKPGAGRRRLVEEAWLRHQARCARAQIAPQALHAGDIQSLWPQHCEDIDDLYAHYILDDQTLCVLHIVDAEDPRLTQLLAADLPTQLLVVVSLSLSTQSPDIVLGALSTEQGEQLCQSLSSAKVPEAWNTEVFTLSQGLPGSLCEFMRSASVLDRGFTQPPGALFVEGSLAGSMLTQVQAMEALALVTLETLAVFNRPIHLGQLQQVTHASKLELVRSTEELKMAGFVREQQGGFGCTSTHLAKLIDSALPSARRRALHRRALLDGGDALSCFAKAQHLLVLGPAKEAASAAIDAIQERSAMGMHNQALALCLESQTRMTGSRVSIHAVLTAEAALTTGDYVTAARYADKAKRSRDTTLRRRAMLALARCAQHNGNLGQALQLLASLVEEEPADCSARSLYAKALLSHGSLADAKQQADAVCLLPANYQDHFQANEVAGLSSLYQDKLELAAQHFRSLFTIAQDHDDRRLLGRAQGLQGMLSQKEGKLRSAAKQYSDAAHNSAQSGAIHAAAVFHLNSATVLQRSACYAEALDALELALHDLEQSGTPFELAAAHCNRGNLLLALGQIEAAKKAAQTAQALATSASEPRIHFYCHLLLGDVARRLQRDQVANQHYVDADALAQTHTLADRCLAQFALNEMRAQQGMAPSPKQDTSSPQHDSEQTASLGRVSLSLNKVTASIDSALNVLAQSLQDHNDLDLGWKVAILSARTAKTLGHDEFASRLQRTQELFDLVIEQTPEAYRPGLRSHPDALCLDALQRESIPTEPDARSNSALLPWRRLLSLSRRLNAEHRIDTLLDDIIDTAIELSLAERAFLLLRDSQGALEIRVARNIDRESLGSQEQLSQSIAAKVAESGQVILTVDAEQDGRFGASLSVATLQLRSILAVPFRVKNRIVGTLYLDHRFRRAAFDDGAVEVVRELASIAAVALENARLNEVNLQRQQEIDQLNRRLETRLETTEAELAKACARIPDSRGPGNFTSIVGDSSALRTTLALAARAAQCELPVVITGESGTGKELIARAIHDNSERRNEAFVALNCGAVPDSLLEAELFGYRKGAFTGAQSARPGLLQVADGGTLFLDEIADTSLAMQSKLLRALQDGEIRPLGSETVVHLNLRVLCASNKPLEQLVQQGVFREDLFYRIHVLNVHVPPLRERRSDIPLLASHILSRLGFSKTLDAATLQVLRAWDWPGNIRELENELSRACALADTQTIQPSHLSSSLQTQPQITASQDTPLLLKQQVEELEQKLIRAAMLETKGNQSKAAQLLGLSRYGLQKKLLRYNLGSDGRA